MSDQEIQSPLYVDLWVASDGCTVVRFPDLESATIYCHETQTWNVSDLRQVRHKVIIKDGAILIQNWVHWMDSEVGNGTHTSEGVWVPDWSDPVNNVTEDWGPMPPIKFGRITQRMAEEKLSFREANMLLDQAYPGI